MVQAIVDAAKRLYELVWGLLVIVLLGGVTVVMWHFYQVERLQSQFRNDGKAVTIQIAHTDRRQRDIWDVMGNQVYAGFTYQNKSYETRCTRDSTWLSAGDRITLLYLPQLDAFVQPKERIIPNRERGVSRLLKWSVVRTFKRENQLLGGFILVVLALFSVGSGLVVRLTGWTFIQTIAGIVFTVGIGAGAVFFTYDTVRYYQYVDQLRSSGNDMDVTVLKANRYSVRNRHSRSWIHWYTYDAIFNYEGEKRTVAIDEPDYERLTSGSTRLMVHYNPTLDDFIAGDYSPGFSQLVTPAFFWFIFLIGIRSVFARRKPPVIVSPR